MKSDSYRQLQSRATPTLWELAGAGGGWTPPDTDSSQVGLFFYFPLESLVDDDIDYFVNVAYDDALTNLYGPQSAVTVLPAFLDNGAHFENGNVINNPRTLTLATDGGGPDIVNSLNLSNRDFTIRFWAKNDSANDFGYALLIGPNASLQVWDVAIYRQIISLGGGLYSRHIWVILTDPIGNTLEVTTEDIPAADWIDWFRVVVRFDSSTYTLSVQVNDDTPVSDSGDGFTLASVSRAIFVFTAAPQWGVQGYTLDEIFVAPDVFWSDADSTADYGPGNPPAASPSSPTWPNVPGVGIQDEGGIAIVDEGGGQIIEE